MLRALIDNNQTGALKGRSISLINNLIAYTDFRNILGMLLFERWIPSIAILFRKHYSPLVLALPSSIGLIFSIAISIINK